MRNHFKQPAPPTGDDPLNVWGRLFQRYVNQYLPKDILGATWKPDPNGGGNYVLAKTQPSTSAGGTTTTFQITAIGQGDYFTAQTLASDGTTLGGTDYLIAKVRDFRPSLTTEVVDGVIIAHTFSDENHRTSDDGVNPTQNEVCWPRFVVGAEIQASLCSNDTPVSDGASGFAKWIDLTKRVWMTY